MFKDEGSPVMVLAVNLSGGMFKDEGLFVSQVTVLVVNLSMGGCLKMRDSSTSTTNLSSSPWPTRVHTLMDHNSSCKTMKPGNGGPLSVEVPVGIKVVQ